MFKGRSSGCWRLKTSESPVAPVAQETEQRSSKPSVVGANPTWGVGVLDGELLGVTEQLLVANARSNVE